MVEPEKYKPFTLHRQHAADLLLSPDTCATTLAVILMTQFGADILEEDPIVLLRAVHDEFGADLHPKLYNKINAYTTAIFTGAPYDDPDVLAMTARALDDGDMPDEIALDDTELPEVMWALFELGLVFGDDEPDTSSAVNAYIKELVDGNADDPTSDQVAARDHVDDRRVQLATELISIGVDRAALSTLMVGD